MQNDVSEAMLKDLNVLLKDLPKDCISKIAVSYQKCQMHIWTEIPDDREDIEGELIMLEAKINAKYHSTGFYMVLTIVEICDQLPVPDIMKIL
ncbi:hypothetical protein [Dyadobacter crusticola]|uniref:hypothetical protein n=1 Tax=Dyadobacter crusticola TaxID=292407 RepID=UPI0004E1C2F7|nr:hypothetical protein [Dyadobacter crusticola]